MLGSTLGERYRILRLIGAGGIGAVYEALDTHGGARVAIKVLAPESARRRDLLDRFEREARAAGALRTPHVVRVLDFGQDRSTGSPFMVMDLEEGEDLQQILQANGPIPWELALKIGAQACAGLAVAHAQQIVHRDIKPANLFLAKGANGERTVKLLDFGVAKVIPSQEALGKDAESLTRTGTMLGSPLYMSPEQARGQRDIDARADLWSLGVVLYKALTGRTPHQDTEALGELIISICTEAPAPIRELAPWVPRDVAEVVSGALGLDPGERFQSADAMRRAIEALLPRGTAIHESMLRPLREEERHALSGAPVGVAAGMPEPPAAPLAPAAREALPLAPVAAPGGMTAPERMAPEMMAPQAMAPVRPAKGAPRWVLLLATALVTALGGALAAYVFRAPATVSSPAPPFTSASGGTARETRVTLVIIPSAATVEVDGAAAKVSDGLVELRGAPGSIRRVRVASGERAVTREVTITESGAVPAKIDLGASAPAPR